MVTLISQFPNEFELHLRAVLGLPIPSIEFLGPSASAVILAAEESDTVSYDGIAVALARGANADEAVARAVAAAARVRVRYGQ